MKIASFWDPDVLIYTVLYSRKQSDCNVSIQLHVFIGVHYR